MDENNIIEEKDEINNENIDNNNLNEEQKENLIEKKENDEKLNEIKAKEEDKEPLLNNKDNNNKDIKEEIIIRNEINNENENKIITDYIITIQYTKFLKIPYFIFADIIHFYFPYQKFNLKEIKLSEISTPPFAVVTKECKLYL